MRKYLFISVIIIGFPVGLLAQSGESIKRDSLAIERLQKLLPSLRDTAKINCLNSLAEAFLNRDGYKIKRRADSAYQYTTNANLEASKIDYKRGLAYSLINFCGVAFFTVIDNNNKQINNTAIVSKWDEYLEKLFKLAKELNDAEIWASAYYCQADFYGKKNNKKAVIEANKKSLEYFEKVGNEARVSEISTWLCMQHSGLGEYEKGFDYCKLSLQLAEKRTDQREHNDLDDYMRQQALINMSNLYDAAADYETALDYLRQAQQFYLSHKSSMTWSVESDLGELFLKMGQYDSASHYEEPINVNIPAPLNSSPALKLGNRYFLKGEYDSALGMFNIAILGFRKNKNANSYGIKNSLTGAARVYLAKKNYKSAFPLVRESVSIAQSEGDLISLRDNFEVLSELFYHTKKNDSAYLYLKKSALLKDSILNRQFYFRLNSYKKEAEEQRKTSQINLLNKDNQLKEQKLKQQAIVRNGLIIGIILLLLLGVFIFRTLSLKRKNDKLRLQKDFEMQQIENDKKHAELKQQAAELEMQALRAQMNPHFIFNCLSSINRFIFKNDNKLASDYLTRFSRLIRMVLIHSSKKLIALEDELEMLRLYLDLERLRFKDAFDYSITTTNIVDAGAIFIPPLLLQPFCENAVWHGLMHKESKGHLNIIISEVISENEKVLHCVIEDDGVGREKAAEMKSKSAESEKSMGLKITTERLALLNRENNFSTFYKIEDVVNENNEVVGTRVQLKIRHKESIEEIA
jgi:tetratricopeptide (TPR) repeat protein